MRGIRCSLSAGKKVNGVSPRNEGTYKLSVGMKDFKDINWEESRSQRQTHAEILKLPHYLSLTLAVVLPILAYLHYHDAIAAPALSAVLFLAVIINIIGRATKGKAIIPLPLILGLLVALTLVMIAVKSVESAAWLFPIILGYSLSLSPYRSLIVAMTVAAVSLLMIALIYKDIVLAVEVSFGMFAFSLICFGLIRVINKLNRQLVDQTIVDTLTGVYNRRYMHNQLSWCIHDKKRYGTSYAAVLIDIDVFKDTNDQLGHNRGDETLISFANLIQEHIRKTDFFFRFGGDEFLVIYKQVDKPTATVLVESLRKMIEEATLAHGAKLTASFGMALLQYNEREDSWLYGADMALYKAKTAGKNCIGIREDEFGHSVHVVKAGEVNSDDTPPEPETDDTPPQQQAGS